MLILKKGPEKGFKCIVDAVLCLILAQLEKKLFHLPGKEVFQGIKLALWRYNFIFVSPARTRNLNTSAMKMKCIPALLCLLISQVMLAQIKIGDNPQNIDPSSVLELESTNRVLVITRVSAQQMNTIVPSPGAMVYNTDAGCVFYFDGIGLDQFM